MYRNLNETNVTKEVLVNLDLENYSFITVLSLRKQP